MDPKYFGAFAGGFIGLFIGTLLKFSAGDMVAVVAIGAIVGYAAFLK
jgi:hypothetical protein